MSLPIGGFMPLPLPMMIPFMAAQSAAMAQAFGTYFQYGKRKISAMSNEEFNKLTPQTMHVELTADIRAMIPSLAKSMHTYDSSMTPQIIKEFSEIAKSAISETTTEVVNTIGGGLELGVSTSKNQINDFIAALTVFMASMSHGGGLDQFKGNKIVQQQDLSVKDIQLELKKSKIPDPIDQQKLDEEEARALKLETSLNIIKNYTPTEKQHADWNQNIHFPAVQTMMQMLARFNRYQTSTNKLIPRKQTVASRKRYNGTLTSYHNAFKSARRRYLNVLTLAKNLRNPIIISKLRALNNAVPKIPVVRWV